MENQSEPGSCLSNRLLARSFLNNKASDLLILVLILSTCILSDPVRYHSIFRSSALNLKFPCYAISSSGLRLQTSRWATAQPVNDHRVHWELGHAYLKALSLSTFLSMNNRCFYIPIAPYSSLKTNLRQQLGPQLLGVEKPSQKAVLLYNPNSCALISLRVLVIV